MNVNNFFRFRHSPRVALATFNNLSQVEYKVNTFLKEFQKITTHQEKLVNQALFN
jgi:hypothetical protein